ncbi:MAG TPA: hypothetical protein P5558_21140 [Geminicoccaceae bacterium]|nr:hypothetical protein [Geminicoccaceae bacterium]
MTAPTPPHASEEAAAGRPFAIALRGAFVPSAVVGVLAVVVAAVVRGPSAIVPALLGLIVGLGFFGSGLFLLSKLVRSANPLAFLAIGMAVYFGQVIVLLLFMIAFYQAAWMDGQAFGGVVLAITIAWQVFLYRAWRRGRLPVYDEPEPQS